MTEREWDENIEGRIVFIRRIESSYGFGSMKAEICVDGKAFIVTIDVEKEDE